MDFPVRECLFKTCYRIWTVSRFFSLPSSFRSLCLRGKLPLLSPSLLLLLQFEINKKKKEESLISNKDIEQNSMSVAYDFLPTDGQKCIEKEQKKRCKRVKRVERERKAVVASSLELCVLLPFCLLLSPPLFLLF